MTKRSISNKVSRQERIFGTLDRLAHEALNGRKGHNLVVKEEVMVC